MMSCASSAHNASLQEYYDACADSSSENDSGEESGEESPYFRTSRQSPLRGRARLCLIHRASVQRAIRERIDSLDGFRSHRGAGAADAASLFASPLRVGLSAPPPHCIVLDALCALRQAPNTVFFAQSNESNNNSSDNGDTHSSSPPVWAPPRVGPGAAAFVRASMAERAIAELLLAGANDVARAYSHLRAMSDENVCDDYTTFEDTLADYALSCTGAEGLRLAARLVLDRFAGVVRALLEDVEQWALTRQDEMSSQPTGVPLQVPTWRREIAERLLPLRRCVHIVESAGLTTGDAVDRAAALLNFLTVHMSAAQGSNTFDQYRFHMTLLLHCCWPYVLLMTYAIFGFVSDIDADAWRASMPRIFRLSFSYIKSSNPTADGCTAALPTDVLSLVLLCIGYERFGAVDACGFGSENRRAAFAALLSARSFVLRSLAAFARQRAAPAPGRKRRATDAATAAVAAAATVSTVATVASAPREWDSWPPAWRGAGGAVPLSLRNAQWALCVHDGRASHDVLLSRKPGGAVLWLHPALPAARWLTAALLVPIARVVQRLHERRVARLLATGPARRRFWGAGDEAPDAPDAADGAALDGERKSVAVRRAMPPASVGVNFRDAVQLMVDVALCRDSERIVYTFLLRLLQEPHWWYRRDEMEYKCTGTASTFISTAFADAVRGMPLGPFVRLSVRPTAVGSTDDCAIEMIHTFAAFELVFSFPWDIELVLLPRVLSVAWAEAGGTRETYKSFFWETRRHDETRGDLTTRDAWSYCFGYLCSLYFTQLSLREQRKRIQRRDVDAYNIMSVLGTTRQGERHAARVARGLGSAYFELSFAVDSILGFTQNVVCIVARELEGDITRGSTANSCIMLCQRLDALLLRLCTVCFPVSGATEETILTNVPEAGPIRERIAAVLEIALDPACLPIKQVTSRTQNAIEGLVAVVRELSATSVIREHIKPLLVLLTFNRFYGQ